MSSADEFDTDIGQEPAESLELEQPAEEAAEPELPKKKNSDILFKMVVIVVAVLGGGFYFFKMGGGIPASSNRPVAAPEQSIQTLASPPPQAALPAAPVSGTVSPAPDATPPDTSALNTPALPPPVAENNVMLPPQIGAPPAAAAPGAANDDPLAWGEGAPKPQEKNEGQAVDMPLPVPVSTEVKTQAAAPLPTPEQISMPLPDMAPPVAAPAPPPEQLPMMALPEAPAPAVAAVPDNKPSSGGAVFSAEKGEKIEKHLLSLEEKIESLQKNMVQKSDISALSAAVESLRRERTSATISAGAGDEKAEPRPVRVKKERPPKKAAKPVPKAVVIKEVAPPAAVWTLKAAKPGMAWVTEVNSGELKTVSVGDVLPSIGRVMAVMKDPAGRWVVNGTDGKISQ